MIRCPQCGRENQDTARACEYCGATWGAAWFDDHVVRFRSLMCLVLSVQHTDKMFAFDADRVNDLTIGRKDTGTGETLNVDLSHVGAFEKGVSRRHAFIYRDGGLLRIIDNDSTNGTYLNGQKLLPWQPRVIRDGDDIRLGCLVLHVRFERKLLLLFDSQDELEP